MSIVSDRSIEAHEEIFVNYNYRVWQAPPWYQEQWVHYKRDTENVPEEVIFESICKMKRDYGVTVPFPNPHKNSDRFAPCATCKIHISLTEASLSCDICDQWHHVSCTPVSVENYTGWTCKRCARHLSSRSISQDRWIQYYMTSQDSWDLSRILRNVPEFWTFTDQLVPLCEHFGNDDIWEKPANPEILTFSLFCTIWILSNKKRAKRA